MSGRAKTFLVNAALLVGGLALALIGAELSVRLLYPQPTGLSHQDRYGLAMHWPGMTRFLPQYGHEVSFNVFGMRDLDHTLEKPPGVFRVLLLGDSFMEALQVPFEASLPSLMERDLSQRTGRQIEVINASVSGWGTDDELRYLTKYGLAFQPDLVIVAMTLHNDISDNLRQQWHTVRNGQLVEVPTVPASFFRYKVIQLKSWLSTRFQLYQLWRRVRHGTEIRQIGRQLNSHVAQLFKVPTPLPILRGVELTDRLLAGIRDAETGVGGRVVLVLLPITYQLSDAKFAGLVEGSAMPSDSMDLGHPQEVMTPIADSLGIPVIDLLPKFRQWLSQGGAPLYLETDGHWNEAGHRLAAEVVSQSLIENGAVH